MKHLRSVRGLAAVGTLVAVTWFVVLPAFGAPTGQLVPPPSTPAGVTPTDVARGGPNGADCAAFYKNDPNDQPTYSYYIANPEKGGPTYTTTAGGQIVTFTLKEDPPNTKPSLPAYGNDKYLSFSSTGAAVTDVGIDAGLDENQDIKGVTDETRYNYSGQTGGFVTADGYLHPPAQSLDKSGNPAKLYSFSHVTFCFNLPSAPVSGTVYQDSNQDGLNNDGSPQQGWTVDLYRGATLVHSTTSGADGSYTLMAPISTTGYTVCEQQPSTDTGMWAQSQPAPNSTDVCAGPLKKGYPITVSSTAPLPGNDFGNDQAVACGSNPEPNYTVEFSCAGKGAFVFNASTTGNPFVSVWAGDATGTLVPVVEKITFADPITSGQPAFTGLKYTDTFPFDPSHAHPMKHCNLDPRSGEFTLAPPYDTYGAGGSGLVLPTGETSCLISLSIFANPPASAVNGTLVAYVYSAVDGWRGVQ